MPEMFSQTDRYNDVPVILGTNRDEAKLFMAMDPKHTKRVLGIFPRLKDPEGYERSARYSSDAWKVRGVDDPARLLRATQGPTVFAYRFDWDEQRSVMGFDLSKALGAAHGMEIPFVFHNFSENMTGRPMYAKDKLAGRDALSTSMMSYWAQFAYTGDPARGRSGREALWKAWDNAGDGEKLMVFDTRDGGGIRMVSDELTMGDLKARLLADGSFTNQEDLCRTYVELFRMSLLWNPLEYETLGDGGCKAFPPEMFGR
jgi:para-nitrobenzyl esterase